MLRKKKIRREEGQGGIHTRRILGPTLVTATLLRALLLLYRGEERLRNTASSGHSYPPMTRWRLPCLSPSATPARARPTWGAAHTASHTQDYIHQTTISYLLTENSCRAFPGNFPTMQSITSIYPLRDGASALSPVQLLLPPYSLNTCPSAHLGTWVPGYLPNSSDNPSVQMYTLDESTPSDCADGSVISGNLALTW